MVTSGAAEASSTVRRKRLSTMPSLLRARHRNPFSQNVWRRRNQNHHHVGIGAAHGANHRARYVGDDGSPSADFVVDPARERIAVAMRLPVHGIFAARQRLLNVVRGGSHSGNIAAIDLAREGLLDILSSDYIPRAC